MTGSLAHTAFVQAAPPPEQQIVVLDASGLENPDMFQRVVRGAGIMHDAPRTGVAFHATVLKHEDPEVLAAAHAEIMADFSRLEGHELATPGVSISVESDSGFLLSFHEVRSMHPQMVELLPSEPRFSPFDPAQSEETGFRIHGTRRDTPEARSSLALAVEVLSPIDWTQDSPADG
jgi:hypothetical protein